MAPTIITFELSEVIYTSACVTHTISGFCEKDVNLNDAKGGGHNWVAPAIVPQFSSLFKEY